MASANTAAAESRWHIIDAEGQVLGRLASLAAKLLQGKNKPTYTPFIDTGDHVVIVNAAKVVLSAGKAEAKQVYRHSGYPGGLSTRSYAAQLRSKPADAVRRSVRGMLPTGPLGRQMLTKLKVYAGPTHPHAAQSPAPLDLPAARAR